MSTEIKKTRAYESFKRIKSNREVDNAHVRKLMNAIEHKNLLQLNPIIINKKREVIDGQHRLEAAKRLKTDIFYVVHDEVTENDIGVLNSNKKNWSVMDYVRFHAANKRPGYDVFLSFVESYPKVPVSTAMSLLSKEGKHVTEHMKNGKIDVGNYDAAVQIVKRVKIISKHFDFAWDRSFVFALTQMHRHPDFVWEKLIKHIENNPLALRKTVNAKQAIEMLEDLYNYRQQNRLHF